MTEGGSRNTPLEGGREGGREGGEGEGENRGRDKYYNIPHRSSRALKEIAS